MEIKIDFKNSKHLEYPKIKIFVDQDLIEEVHFTEEYQSVIIPVDLEPGPHDLEIEHFNKTSRHTKVINDLIVADTKFKIVGLTMDGLEIPTTTLYSCVFVPSWKGLHRPENFPEVLKQALTVGPNGVWKFKFYTPVLDWLIKNRQEKNKVLKNIVSYDSYEPSSHSEIDYILTQEDKKMIKEIKALLND